MGGTWAGSAWGCGSGVVHGQVVPGAVGQGWDMGRYYLGLWVRGGTWVGSAWGCGTGLQHN